MTSPDAVRLSFPFVMHNSPLFGNYSTTKRDFRHIAARNKSRSHNHRTVSGGID